MFHICLKLYKVILKYSIIMALYNPLRIPCSIPLALDHQFASSPGKHADKQLSCPCCMMPIKDTPLPINFSKEDLKLIGNQYYEFFQLCKIIGVALLILFIDTGIPSLQDSFMLQNQATVPPGNYEAMFSPLQSGFPFYKFSIISLLSFISIFLILLIIRVIESSSQGREEGGEQRWAILVRNVPNNSQGTRQKIQNLITSNFDEIRIREIILISKFQTYSELQQKIGEKINDWKKVLRKKQRPKEEILQCLLNIDQASKELQQWKQKCRQNPENQFSGNALVIFENCNMVDQVLNYPSLTKNKIEASFGETFFGEKNLIEFERAVNPSEVNWINLGSSLEEKKSKQRLTYIYLIIMGGSMMLIYFLSQLIFGRQPGKEEQTSEINRMASIFGLALISLIYYLAVPPIMMLIQSQEKDDCETEKQIGLMKKFPIFNALVRILIVFSVQNIFYSGPVAILMTVNKITIMVLVDLVIGIVIWISNPLFLLKKLRRYRKNNRDQMTQSQANALYQNPSFNSGLKFSILINTFWLGTMLCNVVPVVLLFAPISLFIYYWIEKYNFSRRQSIERCPLNSSKLIEAFLCSLEASLVLKPFVNVIFWGMAHGEFAYQQLFMLLLGFAVVFLKKEKIVHKLMNSINIPISQKVATDKTEYCEQNFKTIYQVEYPITGSFQAKKQFLEMNQGIHFRSEIQEQQNDLPLQKAEAAGEEQGIQGNLEQEPQQDENMLGLESERNMSQQ